MAVKVTDKVTVYDHTDTLKVIPWYYKQLRTNMSPPTITPGDMSPSGWSTTEPTISSASDLNYKVYTAAQNVYGNNTCWWGDVSLSSSYEAAIQAYNEAQNAKKMATDYIMTTTGGIWVTPSNKKPDSDGNAINTTRGVRITDQVDIFRGTDSVASLGETVRIGPDGNSGSHILVNSESVDIHNSGLRNLEISGSTNTDGVFGRLRLAPDSLSTGDGYARILGGRWSTPDRAAIRIETHIPDASDYAQLVISSSETKGPFVNVHGTFQTNGDVYVKSHSSPIGTMLSDSASVAISTANINTYAVGPGIALSPGSWIVRGIWQYNSASSARVIDIDLATDNSTAASTTTLIARQRVSNATGAWARLEVISLVTPTADTPVYVKGSATLTSTAQACYIYAMRIA